MYVNCILFSDGIRSHFEVQMMAMLWGVCGVLSPDGSLMTIARWYNHSALTAKILFSTFPERGRQLYCGLQIYIVSFTFCNMDWLLLLWSIDKKCWGFLRSLCLTLQSVCISLCMSTYTKFMYANVLYLTVLKPHGSTVYFQYFAGIEFAAK
jgi:hypothetical protein